MQRTRAIGLSLLILTGLAGCDLAAIQKAAQKQEVSASAQWQPYTSKDGTFSASFPQSPKLQELSIPTPIGDLKSPVASFEGRNMEFTLSKITYPIDPRRYSVGLGLKGAVAGAEVMSKGTVASEKDIFMYGLPGKEVVIKDSYGKAARIRVFIDALGPTLYSAQVVGRIGELNNQVAEKFFDSVDIRTNTASKVAVELPK
jgi:hypothetical protein